MSYWIDMAERMPLINTEVRIKISKIAEVGMLRADVNGEVYFEVVPCIVKKIIYKIPIEYVTHWRKLP